MLTASREEKYYSIINAYTGLKSVIELKNADFPTVSPLWFDPEQLQWPLIPLSTTCFMFCTYQRVLGNLRLRVRPVYESEGKVTESELHQKGKSIR